MRQAERIESWEVERLKPYARNARTHSAEQVAKIAASITRFGFNNPILVASDEGVIAGHGRLAAAQLLGLERVPVIRLDHLEASERRAYVLADNRLAELAGWDVDLLRDEMTALDAVDAELLGAAGFTDAEVTAFLGDGVLPDGSVVREGEGSGKERADSGYTKKIETPVYSAKGQKPEVEELVDRTRADDLAQAVREAEGLPDDVREFLLAAAQRHVQFDYHKIAEFYCHASPQIQRLMEDSALVIVDFGKALEKGYVRLTERLGEIYFETYGEGMDEPEDEGET